MKDLKEKTIRGGSARVAALATDFLLRVGSLAVLARLLDPKDFGLLGMVTAFTGVLSLFRDFGLSAAAIQRAEITEEQSSQLCFGSIFSLVQVLRRLRYCRRRLSPCYITSLAFSGSPA
jgi:O-antigen/teichoic acid export membrane protein